MPSHSIKNQFSDSLSLKPELDHLKSKISIVCHASKSSVGPDIIKLQKMVDPYIQEAKKFTQPYFNQVMTLTKPYRDKVFAATKPYTKTNNSLSKVR